MKMICFISLTVAIVALATYAMAEVPQLINYQGRLTDVDGAVVPDGNYSVTFRIYGNPTATPELWSEGRLVTVKDGLFAVILGSVQPFPPDLFSAPDRWLGLQVGLDPEIAPRALLTSAPFSIHASFADSAGVATASLDKTIDAGELSQGTLDPGRYSSYDDLVLEDRIGDQPGQLSPGNHSHDSEHYRRLGADLTGGQTKSTSWVQVGNTIAIPAGEVTSYIIVSARVEARLGQQSDNYANEVWMAARIGESGAELDKDIVKVADNREMLGTGHTTAISVVSTILTYYEPSQDQKLSGFNVQVWMRCENHWGDSYQQASLLRSEVFGY